MIVRPMHHSPEEDALIVSLSNKILPQLQEAGPTIGLAALASMVALLVLREADREASLAAFVQRVRDMMAPQQP